MRVLLSLFVALACASPGAAQSAARLELDVHPDRTGERASFVLVREGGELFASGELGLVALDATTLAVRWSAGACTQPVAPREEKFAPERTWHAPALTAERVVAALLLAQPRGGAWDWRGVDTRRWLPDRRLHGFERVTGVQSWSHVPDARLAPAQRSFAERMTLLTPPLAVGERVLVACTADESSIDYWLAAYAARDGLLLWKTFVLRGQIERNMFGAQIRDYPTPPLVATPDGKSVVAVTGLGGVVCVDARTGELRWSQAYPYVPLPRTRVYSPITRPSRWRNAAPLVVADVLLVAPPDGRVLCAFDLDDGTPLWQLDEESEFQHFGRIPDNDTLLAADGERILLGGKELSLVRVRGGLRQPEGFELAWSRPGANARRAWRDGERLIASDGPCLALFALEDGTPLGHVEVDAALGFRLDGKELTALGHRGFARVVLP